jgi:hypothetical protein
MIFGNTFAAPSAKSGVHDLATIAREFLEGLPFSAGPGVPQRLWVSRPGPTSADGVAPMFLADPLWLSALATLVTSLSSLVWAVRRRR